MAEKTTSFTGPVVVGLNDKKGEIRLTDGKNVNEAKYLSIAAPATITSDTTLTFPNGAGNPGQILSTDGSGNLSWVNDSAGNPAGTNGQVQTNDGGTFGAISEGTSGQVLTSNGAGVAPTFQTITGADPVTSSLDIGTSKTVKINANSPDGNRNVAVGRLAYDNSPSGSDNVAIGDEALTSATSCVQNTAVGSEAMKFANTNSGNAAFGYQSLQNCTANLNSAFGPGSMRGLTNGIFNTAIGTNCGVNMGGSTDNVIIGGTAGNTLTGGNNNIIIGKSAEPSSATISNEITLGNGSIATLRCNQTSITSLSDARDKKDIEDANIGLDFINDLRPVKFVWDTRDGARKDIKEVGFIAQELDEVQQKHGVEDHLQLVLKNNPDKLEASQGKLIPILVQAIKDLKKEIDELKKA